MKKKSKKDAKNPAMPNSELKNYGKRIMKLISEMGTEEKNQTLALINTLLDEQNRVNQ